MVRVATDEIQKTGEMDLNRICLLQMPARLVFGSGCSRQAGQELKALGGSKVLVVTDRGVRNAGVLSVPLEGLQSAGVAYEIYDGVEANPSIRCVDEGVALYRSGGCDCLLGVGGGSSMDTAKVMGAVIADNAPVRDLMGLGKVKNPLPLLVLVPTTCGTASEAIPTGVITDEERHLEAGVMYPLLFPTDARLDGGGGAYSAQTGGAEHQLVGALLRGAPKRRGRRLAILGPKGGASM